MGAGRRVALPGAALEVNGLVDTLSSGAFWCLSNCLWSYG